MTRAAFALAVLGIALVLTARPLGAQREPGWELRVPDRIEVPLGGSAIMPIAIAVDRGLTVSRDGPVIVELYAEPGLAIKKRRLGRADAVDPEADAPRFAVAVHGDGVGDHTLKLHVKLWLCGGKACRPLDLRRVVTITVATPAAPADAGIDGMPDARHQPR
ncbi:MAG: hypothetical protein H6Q90_4664 [Deltaproteobacteria bacterium]|nr:hypothetical protein [Deltaproteobacteria bacterium]